jgi:hypothetical protein
MQFLFVQINVELSALHTRGEVKDPYMHLGAVYMSPVCWAGPLKRGARLHSNFQHKTILLYMTTGPARLAGISLDSNGAARLKFLHVKYPARATGLEQELHLKQK